MLCNTRYKHLTLITRSGSLTLYTKFFWSASGHSAHCWACCPVYQDTVSMVVHVSKLIHLRSVPTTDSTTGLLVVTSRIPPVIWDGSKRPTHSQGSNHQASTSQDPLVMTHSTWAFESAVFELLNRSIQREVTRVSAFHPRHLSRRIPVQTGFLLNCHDTLVVQLSVSVTRSKGCHVISSVTGVIQIRSFTFLLFALIIMLRDTCLRFLEETITFQFIFIICVMFLVSSHQILY